MSAKVSVLAELERLGLDYEWAGHDEIKLACPFHEDDHPSCMMSVEKAVFNCKAAGCGKKGDFETFLARVLKTTRVVVAHDLAKRYGWNVDDKPIDPAVVEKAHQRIWRAEPLLNELYRRAVTDDDIRKYRLGEDRGRVTIPVKNATGTFVNLRRYLPGAPGDQKMKNVGGRGKMRLFPIDQLDYDEVVVVGGEIKAIVAARLLNPKGIGVISPSGGEGQWVRSWNDFFLGKSIYVCLDIDEAGRKASNDLCRTLMRTARQVHDVVLPLRLEDYPHGDVNDFVYSGGDLYSVVRGTPVWTPPVPGRGIYDLEEEPLALELAKAVHASKATKRVKVRAVVTALHPSPFTVPSKVNVQCGRDQPFCPLCGVFPHKEEDEIPISPEDPSILKMVGANDNTLRVAVAESVGVPDMCKVWRYDAIEHYNAEDVRISPQLDISDKAHERSMQPAVCIGDGVELNESYEFVGRMHPNPSTQEATLVMSRYTATQDALSNYTVDPVELARLEMFQPSEWTSAGIAARLDLLYEDLEANVTTIYQRRSLHLCMDLVYHSPLLMTFDGRVRKGWAEALILGDSSQGKSEVACGSQGNGGIMTHYGLGVKVECKNASVAGLLGGLQQIGGKWYVTWGVIPTHDRRLVILEELKGANTEVIAKLTDMRSSGVAEIPKIERRRAHARTRIIALSNPRSEMPMQSYNYGVEAARELIGALEDIRRFDLVMCVSKSEIDHKTMTRLMTQRVQVPHTHTSELCRSLVLWTWTRDATQVRFDDDTTDAILQASSALQDKFSDDIPIVDRGSMRYKLARLCASLAGRTFSVGDDLMTLRVRRCHVDYVYDFLDRTYSSGAMGYADYTQSIKQSTTIDKPEEVKQAIRCAPFPRDLVMSMLHANFVELNDIQDWCGWDRPEAQDLLSTLVRKHALLRRGRVYRKTPDFIHLLRELAVDPSTIARPEYIREEKF